jgi:hypothetical protein
MGTLSDALSSVQINFEGEYDLIRFIKEVQSAGLYLILRIGPYVCAEWNLGYATSTLRCLHTDTQPCLPWAHSLYGHLLFKALASFHNAVV